MDPVPLESLIARLDPVLEAVLLLVTLLPVVAWTQVAALLALGAIAAGLSGLDAHPKSSAHLEDR